MAGNLAPSPGFPERGDVYYERNNATPTPGRQGSLRFQEGLVTDPAVPGGFRTGASQGYETGGRSNHNKPVYIKSEQETMAERGHPGSAAWTESPTMLGDFAHGASPVAERKYESVTRDGGFQARVAPAVVRD